MKQAHNSSFKFNPIAAAIAIVISSPFGAALAGSGFGSGVNAANAPVAVPTYYANSPAGPVPALDNTGAVIPRNDGSGLPRMVNSGKALRKFVDTLPGLGVANINNLGQYIPVAVPEKWIDGNGVVSADDYYEIAAVEFDEKMHSDLAKATHMRGYVQLSTATNPGLHIALSYPDGSPIRDGNGAQVYAYDKPHHLGPVINSTKGTAVRVKFSNYLPVGGKLFIPVDTTITGAGMGPDGVTAYTQNRAEIHLVGGQSPWISAGTPHQWVAPAGEAAAYAAGLGKGVSAQNVPDMADPGAGATTLYFPNDLSARFMFYQDRTSGLTRLNSYAGLEAGYFVSDDAEKALIASGAIPADQIPLIIEDKTFVPANVAQQDAKWTDPNWGQPGDLWFPHVYETNQDPASINGTNPVGRWDYGPLFWPIFAVDASKATLPTPSFTPEAYLDTPLINGTAYPTLTVDPKAYRLRILNASNDRYINLGLYKADASVQAPQLDQNGNPTFDAKGNQLFFTNTEVKMVPAVGDKSGNPPGWGANDPLTGSPAVDASGQPVQSPLLQYPTLKTNINAEPSGPSRAWPVDARPGGAPDPLTAGPDFVVIGNDGGFLPNPVDIPAQPITYEANRRSITVGNIYGYGMLLGPAERADAIVDFSKYAGQTLILFNDAPAPTPFNDVRNDYYTGGPDQTGQGGAYSTQPGYGPNTRTMMQIVVSNNAPAPAFNADALNLALPAAYGASQPNPLVPAAAYNTAFGTNDTDVYAHVATGSIAQPTLDFITSAGGAITLTSLDLITSGGTAIAGGQIVGNAIPGSGTGYDPLNPPIVVFNNTVNGQSCLGAGGRSASAIAVVDQDKPATYFANGKLKTPFIPSTQQVTGFTQVDLGSGYTCAPIVTFTNPPGTNGIGAQASLGTANSFKLPVQAKAEQELFDDYGRYNSTGGVEIPLVSGVIQTTVPLNYIDSTTEIIGDGEIQLWKLVDNGFWSNSIHFDMVDVQLVNRVGWDGTVKAPATNEVGWKDTLRLNPLEDVIVAMRAKRATVPFGLPQSKRLLDPSKPLNTTGAAASGLGFTTAAGITPALSASNVVANFDNEFAWNSAILGHSENDFTRAVAFHPNVVKPAAPTNLGGSAGALNWTDPTPLGALGTLANPQNEIGFTISRASYSVNGNLGAYSKLVDVAANVTSFTDATQVAGIDYSYKVAAWNTAGSTDSAPYTEITAPAIPTWLGAGVAINANTGAITLTWNTVTGATAYILTVNGTPQLPINAAFGATQSTTISPPLGSVYNITVTAQQAKFGQTATSGASAIATADLSLPVAPIAPTMGATTITAQGTPTVNWNAVPGATGYLVSVNGAAFVPVAATSRTFPTVPNAGSLATGASYSVAVYAQTTKFGVVAQSATAASTTVDLTPPLAPAAPANVQATLTGTTVSLSWPTVTNAVNYLVQVSTNGSAFAPLPAVSTNSTTHTLTPGNSYVYQVAAQSSKSVSSYVTTANSGYTSSATVLFPPVALAVPSNLAGTINNATGAVSLSWTALTAPNGSTVNYQLIIDGAAAITVGNPTYVPVPALALGSAHTVSIASQVTRNALSTVSAFSTPATTVDLSWPATPAAPALNATTITTSGRPTLSWTAVSGASAYLISVNGGAPVATTNTTYQFPSTGNAGSLALGSSYNVTVAAQTTKFSTPFVSTPTPTVIDLVAAQTPAAPVNVVAALNGTTASLSWDVVPNATSYQVQVSTNGGTTWSNLPSVATNATSATVTAGNSYLYQVAALTTKVVSGYTTTSPASAYTQSNAVVTAPAALNAPTGLNATITPTTGAVSLSWTAVTAPTGSTVSYQLVLDGGTPFTVAASPYVPSPALATGATHTVTIATIVTRNGLSTTGSATAPFTVDLTAAAAPVAPATATATATSLSWSAATGVSINATVSYVVTQSVNGGAYTALAGSPFTARTATVTSAAGNNYSYQVQALATRYGLAAASSGLTTSNTLSMAPAASSTPVAVAGALGSKQITVTWTNTSNNLSGFTVQRRVNGTTTTIAATVSNVGTTYSFTDTAPAAGSYTYRITANSAGGSNGPTGYSNAISAP